MRQPSRSLLPVFMLIDGVRPSFPSFRHVSRTITRLARVNSLYRLRNGNVTLIIKGDPQQSRHSYALASRIEISDGDHLIGQCVYDNTEDRLITVG